MKRISNTLFLPLFSLVSATSSYAAISSSSASLVDTSQNQTFESGPTHSFKLAAVHFITNDNALNFGNQEFLPADLCKQGGYTHNGCPAGYVKGDECPYDSKFVKDCIDPDTWCKNNGYNVTSCSVPKYPANPCPYKSSLYKSCETDNIRACKELGYSLTCETGKIGDSAQACPYNSSYKKCICNPCSGYDYTAAQASAPGYVPGEVCNSCGTMKYKRKGEDCDGFWECDDGGAPGAEVCYSGNVKKFSECNIICGSKYQYDSSNCYGNSVLAGDYCDGKYDKCISPAKILYGDGTISTDVLSGKTPVGVVFDEDNRLAAALVDIDDNGKANRVKRMWGGNVSVPLEDCAWADGYNYFSREGDADCGTDGRHNTDILLADTNAAEFYAAQSVYKFQPDGCSAGFCRKGKWFLPSMKDLWGLHDMKNEINLSLSLVQQWGAMILEDKSTGYWSSSKTEDAIGGIYMTDYDTCRFSANKTKYHIAYVRPVVKY